MKLHFGHGVALTLTLFAVMLGWFLVRALRNGEELVTEDYYAKELRFQQDIDLLQRAAAHGESVLMEVKGEQLRVVFPAALRGRKITGNLYLMRPSNARADQHLQVEADSNGTFTVGTAHWLRGHYRARLDWQADGNDHLSEQALDLP